MVMFGLGGACQTQLSRNTNVSSIPYGVSTSFVYALAILSTPSHFCTCTPSNVQLLQTLTLLTSHSFIGRSVGRLRIRRRPRLGFVGHERDLSWPHQPRGDDRDGHVQTGLSLAQSACIHFRPGHGWTVRRWDRLRQLHSCDRYLRGRSPHPHCSRDGQPVRDICGTLNEVVFRLLCDYLSDGFLAAVHDFGVCVVRGGQFLHGRSCPHVLSISQFLKTAALLMVVCAMGDPRNKPAPPGLAPVVLFITMLGISASFGMQTGTPCPSDNCSKALITSDIHRLLH